MLLIICHTRYLVFIIHKHYLRMMLLCFLRCHLCIAHEYEMVQIVDVENGNRFETYTIAGEPGSGMICLNGAAARQVAVGDHVILMCCEHIYLPHKYMI